MKTRGASEHPWVLLWLSLGFVALFPPAQAGAAPTKAPAGWKHYASEEYAYEFSYPPSSSIKPSDDPQPTIILPVQPKTNLLELSLEVSIFNPGDESTTRATTDAPSASKETIVVGSRSFTVEEAGDAGAGNYFEEELYSTARGDTVISFHFRIHSVNADITEPRVHQFDHHQLDRLIKDILSTFNWSS